MECFAAGCLAATLIPHVCEQTQHSVSSCSDVASVDGLSMGGGPGGGLSPAPSPLPNALNSFFNNMQNQVRVSLGVAAHHMLDDGPAQDHSTTP